MKHDAVVVGAGLSGLYVGARLAESGWRVRVVDRRCTIGTPVRCGEATGNRKELARFVQVDDSWIACDVRGLAVHPDGVGEFRREIEDTGVVLRRDRFEQALARRGTSHGMELQLERPVVGLSWDQERCLGVVLDGGDTVEATFVVAADGAESMVGRWAGITQVLSPRDAFTAAQYSVRGGPPNDGLLHFHVGPETVPGGYIWVFPKGDGMVSVGAGIFGCPTEPGKARRLLDAFLRRTYPDAEAGNLITGCVPLAICPRRLSRANLLVVGDAARQANPLTAGGIMNSLEAAEIAVGSLLKCGRDGRDQGHLGEYSGRWSRRPRREQKAFYVLKELFLDLSARELRYILEAASAAFAGPIDRTRPFRLPIGRLLRLSGFVLPRLIGHSRHFWK